MLHSYEENRNKLFLKWSYRVLFTQSYGVLGYFHGFDRWVTEAEVWGANKVAISSLALMMEHWSKHCGDKKRNDR